MRNVVNQNLSGLAIINEIIQQHMSLLDKLQFQDDSDDEQEYETVEVEHSETVTKEFPYWNYKVVLSDGETIWLELGRMDEREGGIAFQSSKEEAYYAHFADKIRWRRDWYRERIFSYENLVEFEKTGVGHQEVTQTVEWTTEEKQLIEEEA